MAVKVPKKEKNKNAQVLQDSRQGGRYFDEEIMKEVYDVANTEREIPDPVPATQPVPTYTHPQPQQSDRVGAGRPKIPRRVERGKAMNVYFDSDTHQLLKNMKFYHDIEMKDIPYVLTREFFKKYETGGKLNDEGMAYLQRLLSEVN